MKLNIIFIAAAIAYGSSAVLALPVNSEFVTRDLTDIDDFDAREVYDADLDAREFDEEIFEREPKSTLDSLHSDLPPSTKSKSKAVESDLKGSTSKPKKKKSLLSRLRSKKSKSSKSLSTTSEKPKKKRSSLLSRLRSKKSTPKKKKLSLRQRLARRRRNAKAKKAQRKKSRLSKLKARKAKKTKTTDDVNLKKSKVAAEAPQVKTTNVDGVYSPPKQKSLASLD